MDGFLEGVLSKVLWAGIKETFEIAKSGKIKITSARTSELLSEAEALPEGLVSFQVRGTLKRLPKGHRIWLLTQDETTGRVWPQGFYPVEFDDHQGTWFGKIDPGTRGHIRIVAVVAPPTSQEFFTYYEKLGREVRGGVYEPLSGIPPECVNQDSVQARVPRK